MDRSDRAGEIPSIRRKSFIESYGIKEVHDEDEGSSSSNDDFFAHRHRKSLTIDDIDDIEITEESGRRESDDVSALDIDLSDYNDIPVRRDTSGSGGPSRRATLEMDISDPHINSSGNGGPSRRATQESIKSQDTSLSSAPNFVGGNSRRKGDKQRRLQQRFGASNLRDSTGDRRASTGTSYGTSFQESFGDMSLSSFTSLNSFTSSYTGNGSQKVEVGNLIFVTDDEMAKIMYGDDEDHARNNKGQTDADTSSVNSNLSTSLPPSATLGSGAFSTVRLAWRKIPVHTKSAMEKFLSESMDLEPSSGVNDEGRTANQRSRRSIVRVESKANDGEDEDDFKHKGELVAIKIVQKSILKQMKTMQKDSKRGMVVHTAYDNIEREIATMKRLRHPNLVKLFEVIDSVESDRLHMVLQYVNLGEILSHVEGTNKYTRKRYRRKVKGLTRDGHFDEKHAALYFVDILHGLAYLHRNRICHRDLKPENILLCASGIAKISDFGVAHYFEEETSRESYAVHALEDKDIDDMLSFVDGLDDSARADGDEGSPTHLTKRDSDVAFQMSSRHDKGMLKKTEGTWCFWSPEMCSVENKGFSGYSSDLWAAGVCLYIFATGTLPFFSMVPSTLFDDIAAGEVSYEGLDLSPELKDLLCKLLDKDPSTRAGVGDCLQHKFCANARNERLHELGEKFNESEEHIILSKNDVDMALSITMPKKHGRGMRKIVSKRYSAPTFLVGNYDDGGVGEDEIVNNLPSSSGRKDGSHLTTVTEASAEGKGGVDSTATSSQSNSHMQPKKKRISLKHKLKKLWGRNTEE